MKEMKQKIGESIITCLKRIIIFIHFLSLYYFINALFTLD